MDDITYNAVFEDFLPQQKYKSKKIALPFDVRVKGSWHAFVLRYMERLHMHYDCVDGFFGSYASEIMIMFLGGRISIGEHFKLVCGDPSKEMCPVFCLVLDDVTPESMDLSVVTMWMHDPSDPRNVSRTNRYRRTGDEVNLYVSTDRLMSMYGGSDMYERHMSSSLDITIACTPSDNYMLGIQVLMWNDDGMSSVNAIIKAIHPVLDHMINQRKDGKSIADMDTFAIRQPDIALFEYKVNASIQKYRMLRFDAVKLFPDDGQWDQYMHSSIIADIGRTSARRSANTWANTAATNMGISKAEMAARYKGRAVKPDEQNTPDRGVHHSEES